MALAGVLVSFSFFLVVAEPFLGVFRMIPPRRNLEPPQLAVIIWHVI